MTFCGQPIDHLLLSVLATMLTFATAITFGALSGISCERSAVVAILLVFVLYFVLQNTAWGLRVRAVGENPHAADTVGINVRRVRYSAVLVGGLFAGLGGATYVPGYLSAFAPGMTNGYGFIA